MLRKITALLLAVTLAFICFGCTGGGQTETEPTQAAESQAKTLLITGSKKLFPESAYKAESMKSKYGSRLLVSSFDDDFVGSQHAAVSNAVDEYLKDKSVKAVIIADGVEGTLKAVQTIKSQRNDICIVVCNPVENINQIAFSSDLIIMQDYEKIAAGMVRQASELGAKTFVFYTFARHADYDYVKQMRQTAGGICTELEMEYVETFSVDMFDENRSLEIAKSFIGEDAARKNEEFGSTVALYSTDSTVQEDVIKAAARYGMIVPATATMSPFAFANAFGADIKGHEADSKYVLAKLTEAFAKSKSKGKMISWEFSAPMLFAEAAFKYTDSVINPADDAKADSDKMIKLNKIFTEAADGSPVSIAGGVLEDGKSTDKVILVSSDFYRY